MSYYVINKGGTLSEFNWGTNGYSIDPRVNPLDHLFDTCELASDVTLKDIFLLVERDLDFYNKLFPSCYVSEVIKESKLEAEESDISYLNLSWNMDIFDGDSSFLNIPYLEGIKDGEEMKFSMSFTSVSKLLHLPVKLQDEGNIYITNSSDCKPQIITIKKVSFTLQQIIYGIFWELTFYVPPKGRDTVKNILDKSMSDYHKGIAKTYTRNEDKEEL